MRRHIAVTITIATVACVAAIEIAARLTRATHNRRARGLGDHLYLRHSGRGEPMLFIHGLRGSGRYWEPGVESLIGRHEILVVDELGFGRSPWPAHARYDVDEHIAWIRRTIEPITRGRKVTVVGHSMGAIIAAGYARRYPDEVNRLVLLNPPMFRNEKEARERIYTMSPMAAMFSINRLLARASCDLVCAFRPLLYQLAPMFDPNVPAPVARDAVLHRWESFDGSLRNVVLRSRLEDTLRSLKGIPLTILHGTKDPITPRERVEAIAAETGARLVFIDGDHNIYLRNPEKALAEISAK